MARQANNYRSFFENAPIGFWRTNCEDGQFLMANLACAKILGFESVDELLKTKSVNMYVNGDRAHMLEKLNADGAVHNFEVQMIRQDGTPIWLSVTARKENDFIEGSIEDITEQKLLQDQVDLCRMQEVKRIGELQKGMRKRLREISLTSEDDQSTL